VLIATEPRSLASGFILTLTICHAQTLNTVEMCLGES
jgi:hypothetical protein